LRSRLIRQCGKHPSFPSKQADWQVLTEWASVDAARADGTPDEVVQRYTVVFNDAICDVQYHAALLSATLLNSNGWVA
jgi:hypothetical protein